MFDTCYAKFGPLAGHWHHVDSGDRGFTDWDAFCNAISRLPNGQLWRHNQAGDLPGNGEYIDATALHKLVQANRGKRGFTFTHYPLNVHNNLCIEGANSLGFTINVSCDFLSEVDRVAAETRAPLTVVLPSTETRRALYTPEGRKVVVCPATYRNDMKCFNCAICYETRPERAVIGFIAHGTKKKVIDIILEKANEQVQVHE